MEDTDANTPTPEEQPVTPEATPEVTPAPLESSQAAAPEPQAPESAAKGDADADPLGPLLAKAATQRLSVPEEEQAIGMLRGRLLAKKDVFTATVGLLPRLGWAVASKSVGAAWPDMKASARTALIKMLAADESEASRRIRLSIARSLFKVPDIAAALKMITGVAKEIRDKDTGAVAPKDAQMFSNVMIGKGKPWIAQLPLADTKPADVDQLIHAGVFAGFLLNQPPITQIGILKWAAEADRLEKLNESAQALVIKGVGKMSGKWQAALRKEVPELPPEIAAALKPSGQGLAEKETQAEDDGLPLELKAEASASEASATATSAAETPSAKERPVYVSKTIPPREQRSPERTAQPSAPPPQQPQQSPKEGRGPAARSMQFNAQEALRQLEAHITFIRTELKNAETKLRSRETDESRRPKRKPDVPIIEGEPTMEELARLNIQLEARITELQSRIDDLAVDSEARATSVGAFAAQPETNPDQQLRTLLALKLQEAYSDFLALESQDRDIVVPQHYGTVLREVFSVLVAEGIKLEMAPQPPPAD